MSTVRHPPGDDFKAEMAREQALQRLAPLLQEAFTCTAQSRVNRSRLTLGSVFRYGGPER
jgi:hypothetical protein